jgi:hypothetical protein
MQKLKNGKLITNIALLSQMRLYSTKRLLNKIGVINKDDRLTPQKIAGRPEGI